MVRHDLPFADLGYGFIGHLTYIPSEDPSQGPGRFHTSRRLEDKPAFRVLQPTTTWLAADRQPPQEPTGDDLDFERAPWKRVKTHHNWLYFKEPEAYAGVGESLQSLLVEGENLYMRDETSLPHTVAATPLLALGNLSTPSRSKSRHRSVCLLATAAGTTGQTLRLTRVRDLQVGWGNGAGENLILHDADLDDPEDHTTWTSDAQPISKIKIATNDVGDDRMRRLLVQKPDSTTIFRPEHRAVPVASSSGSIRPAPPSRIVANKMARITLDMTGGNYHSDVAFNGGHRGMPQQIAIVDERGYWSIWDAARVRRNGRVRATVGYRCFGHIKAGVLDELPSSTEYAARPHGILFVGYAQDEKEVEGSDDGWEDDRDHHAIRQEEPGGQSGKEDFVGSRRLRKASKAGVTLLEHKAEDGEEGAYDEYENEEEGLYDEYENEEKGIYDEYENEEDEEDEERKLLSGGSKNGRPASTSRRRHQTQPRVTRGATADRSRDGGMHQLQNASGRSNALLIWNESEISIVDVPTGMFWPKPDILFAQEMILDVQYSPRTKRHVLVLTTQHIIWLDLFPTGPDKTLEQQMTSILVKSPHDIGSADTSLHLTACRERYPLEDECIVTLIYSSQSRGATVYWFWQEAAMGLPQFHRRTLLQSIGFGDKATPFFQTLSLIPCRVTSNGARPASERSPNYTQHGVRFYQLLTLGRDLSVHSTVCASFIPGPGIQDVLPPDAVIAQKRGSKTIWAQKWKQYLKYLGDAFVVPDELGDVEQGVTRRNEVGKSRPERAPDGPGGGDAEGRPVVLKFKYLGGVLEQDLEAAVAKRRLVSVSVLFKAILHALQEARDSSSLIGLTSLLDLVGGADLVVKHDFDLSGWNDEIERLYDMAEREEDVTIVRKGPVFLSELREDRINVKTLYQQLSDVWLGSLRDDTPDAARSQRERLVRRMTVMVALSSYGIMVGPTTLKPEKGHGPGGGQTSHADIEQAGEGPSSQSSSRSLSQARKAAKAAEAVRLKEKANDALARLRALAGLARVEPGPNALPQHPVLALWPETPGVAVSEYISSVRQASGIDSDAIRGTRERQARREAKKARLRERYGSRASPMVSSQISGAEGETDWETEPETMMEREPRNTTGLRLPFRGREQVRTSQPPSRPVITSSQPRPTISSGRQRAAPGTLPSQPQYSIVPGQPGAFDEASEAQGSSQPAAGTFGARPKAVAKKAKKGAAKIRGFR